MRIRHTVTQSPSFEGETLFRSSATWSILARDKRRAVAFRHPDGDTLYVAEFRPGSPEVVVQCAPRLLVSDEAGPVLTSPFHYPLDQILTMYLLAESGIVVHGAGALVGGKGLAFVGVSGAGKTTLTALAAGRAGWTPLSDDRVIVRTEDGNPSLLGTPWPGEGLAAANLEGPLAGILFLEQGRTNEVRPVSAQDALARLLRTTSVPWYDRDYVGGALETCGRLVSSVPTATLEFRPEVAAVDVVEGYLAGVART